MFKRAHHQAIAQVLNALDGDLLREHHCLFGGGTLIALRYDEYRESLDVDFLTSSQAGYRELRQLARNGLQPLFREGALGFEQTRDVRIDQYGIRTMLSVVGREIKFEVIFEARIELDAPGPDDVVCGIATLSPLDMVASKLLANSDRCFDNGTFNRDIIDLAMMRPPKSLLKSAIAKAEAAYGNAIHRDLEAAIDRMNNKDGWMERCMSAMAMDIPKAVLWKHVRRLRNASRTG